VDVHASNASTRLVAPMRTMICCQYHTCSLQLIYGRLWSSMQEWVTVIKPTDYTLSDYSRYTENDYYNITE